MRVLGPVAAAQGVDLPNQYPALLKPGGPERFKDQVRQQGVGGNEHMGPGHQNRKKQLAEAFKKGAYIIFFTFPQHRKPRNRLSPAAVERRWDSPNASITLSALLKLFRAEFYQPIRGVGDDGMNRSFVGCLKPIQSISLSKFVQDLGAGA